MSSPKPDLRWAKMPNRWAMSGELANFGELNDQGNVDLVAINTSLAALKVYLAICTRANYQTGIAKTTYPELCDLAGHSRNVIARSLEVLESFGYIRRDTGKTRDGSLIYVEKWLENEGFAKIPKSWLYQGRGPKQDQSSEHKVTKLVKLKAFGFNKRISLQALKIYILLLAMRIPLKTDKACAITAACLSRSGKPKASVIELLCQPSSSRSVGIQRCRDSHQNSTNLNIANLGNSQDHQSRYHPENTAQADQPAKRTGDYWHKKV